jgi:hypothetical protein
LPSRKELVPFVEKAGRALEPVWKRRLKKESMFLSTVDVPSSRPRSVSLLSDMLTCINIQQYILIEHEEIHTDFVVVEVRFHILKRYMLQTEINSIYKCGGEMSGIALCYGLDDRGFESR